MILFVAKPMPKLVITSVVGPYNLPVGSTKNKDTPTDLPVRRRVRLFDQQSGRLLRELWSNAETGAYQFKFVRGGTFFVIAFDHTLTYGAEAESDIQVPAP
jgi:hypothetical protein